ncbi:MAG: NAD(P)/FAD-dependent oxidoreductase [Gemmatimonadota bacterium]
MPSTRPVPFPGSSTPGPLRVLIVGGGVAGLTLAALLRRQGREPTVVERADEEGEEGGYMLGLYYLGSRILHGLGVFPDFVDRSVPMRRYEVRNGRGSLVHGYDLDEMTRRVGPVRGISRTALIRLLREALGGLGVRNGTEVVSLGDAGDVVHAVFSDGTEQDYDLVVGADGLHSSVREMILDGDEYAYWETGWGGWVCWADPALAPSDTYIECWGTGRFVGLYPARDRLGVFLGGPTEKLKDRGPADLLRQVVSELDTDVAGPVEAVLDHLEPSPDAFFWDLHDCRTKSWRKGRIGLLGDAATGFLPTAGIGASMAMESAAALADELSRVGPTWVERALDLFEDRHRERVESAQQSSRDMGRMMFVESTPLAWGRDQLVKHYSLERLIESIATMMDHPI